MNLKKKMVACKGKCEITIKQDKSKRGLSTVKWNVSLNLKKRIQENTFLFLLFLYCSLQTWVWVCECKDVSLLYEQIQATRDTKQQGIEEALTPQVFNSSSQNFTQL